MKIAITGSNGMIGRELIKYIKSTVPAQIVSIPREGSACSSGIFDAIKLKQVLKDCDGVIHLAGVSSVGQAKNNPSYSWHLNVEGTRRLLETLQEFTCPPWIIFPSSREVYNPQNKLPVKECDLKGPQNLYGASKLMCEGLIKGYGEMTGAPVAILRLSSVYGSLWDKKQRLIPAFCNAALEGRDLFCNGDNTVLDLVNINDVCRAILGATQYLNQGKQLPILNITGGRGIKLKDIIFFLRKFPLTQNFKTILRSPDTRYSSAFIGDNALANVMIGWCPRIPFQEGLQTYLHNIIDKRYAHENTKGDSWISHEVQCGI